MIHEPQSNQPAGGLVGLGCRLAPWYRALNCVPDWFLQLFARLAIAPMFWMSGETKVVAWKCLTAGECTPGNLAVTLFREEYKLPLLDPQFAATITTLAEHTFPLLLVLGLGTRFAALALFIMTMVIQFLVYPEWAVWWNTHILWVFPLFYVISRGPGPVSLDRLILRLCCRHCAA